MTGCMLDVTINASSLQHITLFQDKNITGLTVFSWFKNPLLGAFTKKDVTDRTTPQQIIFVLAHHSDRQK